MKDRIQSVRQYREHCQQFYTIVKAAAGLYNWQVFPVDVRGIDFIGFRCFHGYTLLRKRTYKRFKSGMLRMCGRTPHRASLPAERQTPRFPVWFQDLSKNFMKSGNRWISIYRHSWTFTWKTTGRGSRWVLLLHHQILKLQRFGLCVCVFPVGSF